MPPITTRRAAPRTTSREVRRGRGSDPSSAPTTGPSGGSPLVSGAVGVVGSSAGADVATSGRPLAAGWGVGTAPWPVVGSAVGATAVAAAAPAADPASRGDKRLDRRLCLRLAPSPPFLGRERLVGEVLADRRVVPRRPLGHGVDRQDPRDRARHVRRRWHCRWRPGTRWGWWRAGTRWGRRRPGGGRRRGRRRRAA